MYGFYCSRLIATKCPSCLIAELCGKKNSNIAVEILCTIFEPKLVSKRSVLLCFALHDCCKKFNPNFSNSSNRPRVILVAPNFKKSTLAELLYKSIVLYQREKIYILFSYL